MNKIIQRQKSGKQDLKNQYSYTRNKIFIKFKLRQDFRESALNKPKQFIRLVFSHVGDKPILNSCMYYYYHFQ